MKEYSSRKVVVKDGNVGFALKLLNRKIKRDKIIYEVKRRRYYIKPSAVNHRRKQKNAWINRMKQKK